MDADALFAALMAHSASATDPPTPTVGSVSPLRRKNALVRKLTDDPPTTRFSARSTLSASTSKHRRARTETDIDASTVFSPRSDPVIVARTLSSSRSVQVLSRPVSVDFTASHCVPKSSSAPSVTERSAIFGGSVRSRAISSHAQAERTTNASSSFVAAPTSLASSRSRTFDTPMPSFDGKDRPCSALVIAPASTSAARPIRPASMASYGLTRAHSRSRIFIAADEPSLVSVSPSTSSFLPSSGKAPGAPSRTVFGPVSHCPPPIDTMVAKPVSSLESPTKSAFASWRARDAAVSPVVAHNLSHSSPLLVQAPASPVKALMSMWQARVDEHSRI